MKESDVKLSKFGPPVIANSPACELLIFSTTIEAQDLQRQVNNFATSIAAGDLKIDNPVAVGLPRHILVTEEGQPIQELRDELKMKNKSKSAQDIEKLIVEKAGKISPGFYVRIERMPR